MIYPKCEQRRHDCFSCDETGHCHCLNNTKFQRGRGRPYKCPFYKSRKDVGEDLININYEVADDEDSAS
jgi:hypothetical protein